MSRTVAKARPDTFFEDWKILMMTIILIYAIIEPKITLRDY